MELSEKELKSWLLEELYEFVLKHKEIQIYQSAVSKDIVHVIVGLSKYTADRSHLNSFISGYKASQEHQKNRIKI